MISAYYHNFISHIASLRASSHRRSTMADHKWTGAVKSLKGVILDMCGVLYDSGEGGGVPISGSIEAVKR